MSQIRVLIVHKTRLACSLMATVLRDEPDIAVVGCAIDEEEAQRYVDDTDLVLVEATLPDNGALKITKTLAESHPHIDVLVIGVEDHPRKILRYVEAGVDGYVTAELSTDDLLENIRAVHDNQALASPEMVAELIARVNELALACLDMETLCDELEALTPRETEVVELVGDGLSNQEIGDQLSIEVGTVKNHVHSILKKLDVKSRYEAAALYQKAQEASAVNGSADKKEG